MRRHVGLPDVYTGASIVKDFRIRDRCSCNICRSNKARWSLVLSADVNVVKFSLESLGGAHLRGVLCLPYACDAQRMEGRFTDYRLKRLLILLPEASIQSCASEFKDALIVPFDLLCSFKPFKAQEPPQKVFSRDGRRFCLWLSGARDFKRDLTLISDSAASNQGSRRSLLGKKEKKKVVKVIPVGGINQAQAGKLHKGRWLNRTLHTFG
jgi:hypothetical protein